MRWKKSQTTQLRWVYNPVNLGINTLYIYISKSIHDVCFDFFASPTSDSPPKIYHIYPQTYICLEGFYGKYPGFEVAKTFMVHGFGGLMVGWFPVEVSAQHSASEVAEWLWQEPQRIFDGSSQELSATAVQGSGITCWELVTAFCTGFCWFDPRAHAQVHGVRSWFAEQFQRNGCQRGRPSQISCIQLNGCVELTRKARNDMKWNSIYNSRSLLLSQKLHVSLSLLLRFKPILYLFTRKPASTVIHRKWHLAVACDPPASEP